MAGWRHPLLPAGLWAMFTLVTAVRQFSLQPTDSVSRYTSWALRPELHAFALATVITVLAAASQLRRGSGMRSRLAALVATVLVGLAVAGTGILHTQSREHLDGAAQRALAQVRILGGVPTGDARDVGGPTGIGGVPPVPIWVGTWRGSWQSLPDCARVTAPPPGWRPGNLPCSFLRGDGLVEVLVSVSSDLDGGPVVYVQAQPAFA